jgi:hypothetical protein
MSKLIARSMCALLAVTVFSCGSGTNFEKPVEVLFFVQGPTGAPFVFELEGHADDCLASSTTGQGGFVNSGGRGIQSVDADHTSDLVGTFAAPYFFIIENERQPIRAVIRNVGTDVLNVQRQITLGVVDAIAIPPGACRSFSNFTDRVEEIAPLPVEQRRMARVDICSFDRDTTLPSGFRCADNAPRGDSFDFPDANAIFLATIGDLESTFRTRCLQPIGQDRSDCQTPATIFMFNPQDLVSAVVTPLNTQVRRDMHADLYVDSRLRDSDRSSRDVIVETDL